MRLGRPMAALILATSGIGATQAPEPAGQAPVADSPTHQELEPVGVATTEVAVPKPPQAPQPLPDPRRAAKASRPVSGDLLDALASCESRQNPQATSPSGRYLGAWQFTRQTSIALGLGPDPRVHPYDVQKAAAAKIHPSTWYHQFPQCSRRLGVR